MFEKQKSQTNLLTDGYSGAGAAGALVFLSSAKPISIIKDAGCGASTFDKDLQWEVLKLKRYRH